jgi:Tol biopolymer transport system component
MRSLAVALVGASLVVAGACSTSTPPPHVGPAWVAVVGAPGTSATAAYAFVSARDTPDGWSKSQIYLMDATGKVAIDITNDANTHHHPTLSPDGPRIAFASSRDHASGIYTMNLDGGAPVLVHEVNDVRGLAWSPAGPIAYESAGDGNRFTIWLVDESGDGARRFTSPTENEDDDAGLAFVDGGRTVVFSRYDRTTHDRDLWIVPFDRSSDPAPLTRTPSISETLPVVSHDGKQLAYRSTHMGPNYAVDDTITIVEVGTWKVVHDAFLQAPARWNVNGLDFTADDRALVFGADANDVGGTLQNLKGEIFVVGVDGANPVRLTRNAAFDAQPVSLPR